MKRHIKQIFRRFNVLKRKKESFYILEIGKFYNLLRDYNTIDKKLISKWGISRLFLKMVNYFNSIKKYIFNIFMKDYTFIGLIFLITFYFIYLRLSNNRILRINFCYQIWWLFAFCYLTLNVAYMLVCSLYARFSRTNILKEFYLEEIPKTAILYTIRNESSGLYERMEYTLDCNNLDNVDLWVLSGDTTQKYLAYEESVISRLRNKFGEEKIKYLHGTDPKRKKREMIELWLKDFSQGYRYFIVCDADSLLPEDTILKLIRKAEHPGNKNIAIFQSSLAVVNANTFYSKRQAIGVSTTMNLYTRVQQNIFRRTLYFGHNALVRVEDFKKTSVPKGALSHDIWETVSLEQIGKEVAFCPDIISYEEAPTNYIEDIKRIRRWAKGNLETWKLIFSKNISLGLRFLVIYGVYSYTTQLIFFLWFMSGMGIARNQIWQGLAGLSHRRYLLLLITLIIVFFHKLIVYRGFKDIQDTFRDISFSTIMGLNNIFYVSLGVLLIPFQKLGWKPMKKNPYTSLTLKTAAKYMWPSTLIGIFGIYNGYKYAPYWFILVLPILISFTTGIIVAYLTSLPMENDKISLDIFRKGKLLWIRKKNY